MTAEIWCDHPFYTGYQGSNFGRVRKLACIQTQWNRHAVINRRRPERIFKGTISVDGYRVTSFRVDGIRIPIRISSFILECFVGLRPQAYHACHNNGVRDDDRIENLRWDTVSGNMQDRIKHGTQNRMFNEKNPLTKIKTEHVHQIREAKGTLQEIAQLFNISSQQVSRIRRFKSRVMV